LKTGIVLEGGAMRGIYTAGVLDVFLEEGISADLVLGVSAGAIHGCSYVAGQHGRSIRYYTKYCGDKRFMSIHSLLTTGDMVGEQFCYHDLPERLDPFDHDAFEASPVEYWLVCSNLATGQAEYIRCRSLRGEMMDYLRASASMPFVSHIVRAGGKELLDGGVCDSIPVRAALEKLGCQRAVVVLTRPAGYRKKPSGVAAARLLYRRYPAFAKALAERYRSYNDALDLVEEMEKDGRILVIRPTADLHIARMEKDPKRVQAQYRLGRRDALQKLPELRAFLAGD
jgi:predicted patatin/cPLA2 family phospholipase